MFTEQSSSEIHLCRDKERIQDAVQMCYWMELSIGNLIPCS
jgi:hypothetical protein